MYIEKVYEVEKLETAFTNEMAQVLRITLKRLRVMCKTCLQMGQVLHQMGIGIDSSVPFCTQVSKTYVHGSCCYGQSVVSAEVLLQNSTRAHILFSPFMILQFHCH